MKKRLTISSLLMAALAMGTPMNAGAAKKVTNNKFSGYLFAYFEGSGDKQEKWGYVLKHDFVAQGNPILPGFHADPEILYSNKTGRYYIYSTTDGKPGWGGYEYYVYSSSDLKEWKNEGVVLDAKSDQVGWANGNLWAPAAIEVAKDPIVLIQDPQHEIYGTAHNSVIQKPGTDEWYIVYHRINKDYLHFQPGVHREVCIDKMEFNADGTIKRVVPTSHR